MAIDNRKWDTSIILLEKGVKVGFSNFRNVYLENLKDSTSKTEEKEKIDKVLGLMSGNIKVNPNNKGWVGLITGEQQSKEAFSFFYN